MVFINSDDYTYAYSLFLMNESFEDRLHNLNVGYILNESVDVLHEGFGDTIKEFISKITDAISNALGKFKEFITNSTEKDAKFLKDNKDTILKPITIEVNINNYFEYNTDKIQNSTIPNLEYDKMIQYYDSKEKFIQNCGFSDFAIEKDEKFVDKVKTVLRGGAKEGKTIKSIELNSKLQAIYDYCLNYSQLVEKIDLDITKIKAANKQAFLKAESISKGSKEKTKIDKEKTSSNNTETKEKQTEEDKSSTNNKTSENKESFDYSRTMEYYFSNISSVNEADEKPAGGVVQIEPEKKDGNSTDNTSINKINNDKKDDKSNSNNKEDDEQKKMSATIKLYYDTCAEFLGAKMNISKECYNSYMQILKWNYNKHTEKKKDESEDTNKSTANDVNSKLDNAGKTEKEINK